MIHLNLQREETYLPYLEQKVVRCNNKHDSHLLIVMKTIKNGKKIEYLQILSGYKYGKYTKREKRRKNKDIQHQR